MAVRDDTGEPRTHRARHRGAPGGRSRRHPGLRDPLMGLFKRKKGPKSAIGCPIRGHCHSERLFTTAGPYVDLSSTLGLSTAARVRGFLVSESIGMMPLKVYLGREARSSRSPLRMAVVSPERAAERGTVGLRLLAGRRSVHRDERKRLHLEGHRTPAGTGRERPSAILVDPSQVMVKRRCRTEVLRDSPQPGRSSASPPIRYSTSGDGPLSPAQTWAFPR